MIHSQNAVTTDPHEYTSRPWKCSAPLSYSLDLIWGALTAMLILGLGGTVDAHDLWLIPPEAAELGKPVLVRAHSGMEFPVSEQAPKVMAFKRRFSVGPDGTTIELEAAGAEEVSGLMRFTPRTPGVHIIAVETQPRLLTLSAAAFNNYLISDGLPHIYHLRVREKMLDQEGKERYSKSPKALLKLGEGGDPTRALGLPLEIVPLKDPFNLKIGDTLRVRVLFEGKPLRDANLGWDLPRDGEAPSGTVRTDAQGEALIPIAQTGLMTVRLTHMTRPRNSQFEWESFWTTLTWRIPG